MPAVDVLKRSGKVEAFSTDKINAVLRTVLWKTKALAEQPRILAAIIASIKTWLPTEATPPVRIHASTIAGIVMDELVRHSQVAWQRYASGQHSDEIAQHPHEHPPIPQPALFDDADP